jgi:type I restriction enzyme S subunit
LLRSIPPKKLTLELEKIIATVLQMKVNNDLENQRLSQLRDWLLPMLMNGQVTVKDMKAENLSMPAEPEAAYGKKKKW